MKNVVIDIQNISKSFYIERPKTLKKWFYHLFLHFEKIFVINNFSLKVNKGEFVIVTGENGSGKTTLLKIIAGITEVDSGIVKTKGKIVPLIELTAGFNIELSGLENIIINATVLGIEKRRIKKIIPKIIKFSGIKEFIYNPVKKYSTGMIARLGFAIAVHSDPDILLLDETLVVGDKGYWKKSINKVMDLNKKGVTILWVTQFYNHFKIKCDRIINLN